MCYKQPQWANQPLASCGVIMARASVMAWSRTARVRAAFARKMAVNFDHPFSIGDKSGEYGGRYSRRAPTDSMNWLQVLGTAELPHIDQGVRQHFHGKMSLLYVFKTQEQPLELVLPRKCPIHTGSQGMDGFVEQTLSSSLRVLSITRILFNVGDHAGVENALAIVRGIKTSVEIDIRASEVQTDLFGYLLQGFQTIWKQHH